MISDIIEVKGIIWEDTVNYKKIGTTLMMPKCNFKCDKENGIQLCQNSGLAAVPSQLVHINTFMRSYISNPLTEAIILQGLEPLDTPFDVYTVAAALNNFNCKDDFIIYTGYTEEEVSSLSSFNLSFLRSIVLGKLIIKYGRYRPNHQSHYDPILGINLISDNQYAKEII